MLKNGNHVVHTSLSSAWNGMESDKAIKCNYMKDIKGTGGPVSGTGLKPFNVTRSCFQDQHAQKSLQPSKVLRARTLAEVSNTERNEILE